MDIDSRQDEILGLLRANERVEVEELARHFGVTLQTIRNDLRELSDRGLALRTRVGATLVQSASDR